MAGDAKKLQPIIVKKIKKGGHAAHGGAWKIAYADFVTAMMAFFLLMWLLGSTTDGDRKGIADFFNSPIKLSLLNPGAGSGDSSHVIKGGGEEFSRQSGQVKRGDVDTPKSTYNLAALREEVRRADAQRLEELQTKIAAEVRENDRLKNMADQLKLDMTPDGLRIQIVDAQNRPMFALGSAQLQPYTRDLMRELGDVLSGVPNHITLEGHTDTAAYGGGERGYSNWELSADRGNASRRELLAGGLPENRVLRVMGLASSRLYNPQDGRDPQNRRISIIVMNRDAEERFFRNVPDVAHALDAPAPQKPGPIQLPISR